MHTLNSRGFRWYNTCAATPCLVLALQVRSAERAVPMQVAVPENNGHVRLNPSFDRLNAGPFLFCTYIEYHKDTK